MNPFASAAQRYAYLIGMAVCLAALLSFEDRVQRLGACIGLIFFHQLREISLLSEVEPVRLNKKVASQSVSSSPAAAISAEQVELEAKKGFASYLLGKRGRDAGPPPVPIIG